MRIILSEYTPEGSEDTPEGSEDTPEGSEDTPEHSEDAYRLREENGNLFLDRLSQTGAGWLGFYEITEEQAEWLHGELSFWLSHSRD